MAETEKKSGLYLITGLVFGLVIGLVIATLIAPATSRYASPAELDAVGKDIYREEIALAYSANGALNRAVDRLLRLEDPQVESTLIAQAQRLQAAGGSERVIEALMSLAQDLGGH